ncbi:hypothetical protein [Streptomyces sp. G-5]|uniref:hypothetical protein n=1 Tax=Streptomyces sp. G-5 TaxID=2977231 RepID=UPI0021D1558D|nr:hypothetical protein [Streptomyces sp. G-5]MCU4749906.1 hypothetical protein [Streptomyces sp. G-5]
MESTPMPEPLRRAVHELVSEAVFNCQEVLRYSQPDLAHDWQRMTLYRAGDAADTMDLASMLIAAFCQQDGIDPDTLRSYLQTSQQHSRAAGTRDSDHTQLAGLLGRPAPKGTSGRPALQMAYGRGQRHAEEAQRPEEDPQKLFTEACLHGLRAKICDDIDSLDSYLPPHIAAMARRVAEALEIPQPANT